MDCFLRRLRAELGYWVRQYRKNPCLDMKNILGVTQPGAIFDIGAHHGETTAAYLKYFTQSVIYGFEPYPDSYYKLEMRFKDEKMVKMFQLAISNRNGMVEFCSNVDSATNSLLSITDEAEKWLDLPDTIKLKNIINVKVTSIDEFCMKEGINQIMILKMDMQGGELLALEGAEKMLRNKAIYLIYSELLFVPIYIGQAEYYQVCTFLSKFGYKLFDMYNFVYDKNGKLKWCDGLFVGTEPQKLR